MVVRLRGQPLAATTTIRECVGQGHMPTLRIDQNVQQRAMVPLMIVPEPVDRPLHRSLPNLLGKQAEPIVSGSLTQITPA